MFRRSYRSFDSSLYCISYRGYRSVPGGLLRRYTNAVCISWNNVTTDNQDKTVGRSTTLFDFFVPCYGLSYCHGMAPKNNSIMNKEDYYRSHASKQKCTNKIQNHRPVPMQCIEHLAAQRIANLRIQKSENAPFLPSENRFFRPSRACVFVPAKLAVLTKMCKRPIRGHYRFVWKSVAHPRLFVWKNVMEAWLFGQKSVILVLLNWRIQEVILTFWVC